MALLDDVRVALRVTSTMTDVEVQGYIDAAIADMRRVGVREELLSEETMNSLARHAVVMFCKSSYGYDNSEADRFRRSYDWAVTALMNSTANECAS